MLLIQILKIQSFLEGSFAKLVQRVIYAKVGVRAG